MIDELVYKPFVISLISPENAFMAYLCRKFINPSFRLVTGSSGTTVLQGKKDRKAVMSEWQNTRGNWLAMTLLCLILSLRK
jgi:hypothetical protein